MDNWKSIHKNHNNAWNDKACFVNLQDAFSIIYGFEAPEKPGEASFIPRNE